MSSELEETVEQLRKQQSPSAKLITKYLRLVSGFVMMIINVAQLVLHISNERCTALVQVRELKTTDPEGVARYGGLLLNSSSGRSSVSEEEREFPFI